MIVLFSGGGPVQGLMKNFSAAKTELRIATPEMVEEGRAAVYLVKERSDIIPGKVAAVAVFVGVRDSAASLVDFVTEI